MKPHVWVFNSDFSSRVWSIYKCETCGTEVSIHDTQTLATVVERKGLQDCDEQLLHNIHRD